MSDNGIMLLDVSEDKMQDKRYQLSVLAIANTLGYVDREKNARVFSKNELLQSLQKEWKLSRKKLNRVLDTLQSLGCVMYEKRKDECYLNPVSGRFLLKLNKDVVHFCMDALSADSFKVYCYLLNMQAIKEYRGYKDNFLFSKKKLMSIIGLTSDKADNYATINNILTSLKKLGMIDYSEDYIYQGNKGRYYELKMATCDLDILKKSKKQTKKDVEKDDYTFEFAGEMRDRKYLESVLSVSPTPEDTYYRMLRPCIKNEKWLKEFDNKYDKPSW